MEIVERSNGEFTTGVVFQLGQVGSSIVSMCTPTVENLLTRCKAPSL